MASPFELPLNQSDFTGFAGTTSVDGVTVRDGRAYYDVAIGRWQFEGVIEGHEGQDLVSQEFEMRLEDGEGRTLECPRCIISGYGPHLLGFEVQRGKPVTIGIGEAVLSNGAIADGDEVRVTCTG